MRTKLAVTLSLIAMLVVGAGIWASSAQGITAPEQFTLAGRDTEEAELDLGGAGAVTR